MTRLPPPSPMHRRSIPHMPQQVMLGMACWWSSPAAWLHAKHALPSWSRPLQPKIRPLLEENETAENESLVRALHEEAGRRFQDTLTGLTRYVIHPYRRNAGPEGAVLWQRDNVRLLDYSGRGACDGGPVLLIIPSLINRAYVFDLQQEASFVTHMAQSGIRPLLVDWGEPLPALAHLDCAGYVERYLMPAMQWLARNGTERVDIAGYCMGGVFAAALAQLMPQMARSLALLASPWDFHVPEFFRIEIDAPLRQSMTAMIRQQPLFPAAWLQSLFYMGNPWIFHRKYQKFAALDQEGPEAADFVALEEWVNDGVNLTAAVAEECLLGWVTDNRLASGGWRVGGVAIDPKTLSLPVFAAIPRKDRVVPPACAEGLVAAMPQAHVHRPLCGHLGIMAGRGADRAMWQPLAEWLRR